MENVIDLEKLISQKTLSEIEKLISEIVEIKKQETIFLFADFFCCDCFHNFSREILENETEQIGENDFCENCNSDNLTFYLQKFQK